MALQSGEEVRRCPLEIMVTGGWPNEQYPNKSQLYCTAGGKFYSLTDKGLRPVAHNFSPKMSAGKWKSSNGISGSQYPAMRHFGTQTCHKLVAYAWLGPRPEGMEIDHLNGDIRNYSVTNLQYVTPAENRKRAKILRILRQSGQDPRSFSREELLNIFAKYEFRSPQETREEFFIQLRIKN